MPISPDTVARLGLDQPLPAVVNGRRNGVDNDPAWDAAYHPCSEAHPGAGVPEGDVTKIAG